MGFILISVQNYMKIFSPFFCVCLQVRRVDPTLDMEADQGDDYTHLPVW